jgi:hypothetical protein
LLIADAAVLLLLLTELPYLAIIHSNRGQFSFYDNFREGRLLFKDGDIACRQHIYSEEITLYPRQMEQKMREIHLESKDADTKMSICSGSQKGVAGDVSIWTQCWGHYGRFCTSKSLDHRIRVRQNRMTQSIGDIPRFPFSPHANA